MPGPDRPASNRTNASKNGIAGATQASPMSMSSLSSGMVVTSSAGGGLMAPDLMSPTTNEMLTHTSNMTLASPQPQSMMAMAEKPFRKQLRFNDRVPSSLSSSHSHTSHASASLSSDSHSPMRAPSSVAFTAPISPMRATASAAFTVPISPQLTGVGGVGGGVGISGAFPLSASLGAGDDTFELPLPLSTQVASSSDVDTAARAQMHMARTLLEVAASPPSSPAGKARSRVASAGYVLRVLL
jgi:hypothetical protein